VPLPADVTVGVAVFAPLTLTARSATSLLAVLMFPLASRTVIVTVVALPAVPAGTLAVVVPATAAPAATLKALLTRLMGPAVLAVSVYAVPVLSMVRALNVAMPPTAATLVVPPRLAPAVPVPPVIATATLPVNPVARFPRASRAVTTTPNPAPAVVLAGCVVNTSWLAVPAATLNAALTPLIGPAMLAVIV
jgi:hypothetical protein